MAGVEKIVEKMQRQPYGITFSESQKVLEAYGFKVVRHKGSHYQFRRDSGELITIKKDSPTVKRAYIEDILSRIGK